MKIKYLECSCYSTEHAIKIILDNDGKSYGCPPELYIEVQLNQYRSFFKKLWVAIKYVFGYKCVYGHWDCATLNKENVIELKSICDECLKEIDAYERSCDASPVSTSQD